MNNLSDSKNLTLGDKIKNYKPIILIYFPCLIWAVSMIYSEIFILYEVFCFKQLISKLGFYVAYFAIMESFIDVVSDVSLEYLKSVKYTDDKTSKKLDHFLGTGIVYTILVGILVKLFLVPSIYTKVEKVIRFELPGFTILTTPLDWFKEVLKVKYFNLWATLVCLYFIWFLVSRFKILLFSILELSIIRRIQLGCNLHFKKQNYTRQEQAAYKSYFENIRTTVIRVLFIIFCVFYGLYGWFNYGVLYAQKEICRSELVFNLFVYSSALLFYIIWHSHIIASKTQEYDYSLFKDISVRSIIKKVIEITKNGFLAILKSITRSYDDHESEVKSPALKFGALLCLNLHCLLHVAVKRLYDTHFSKKHLVQNTIGVLFSETTLRPFINSFFTGTCAVMVILMVFQILTYVKGLFVDLFSEQSSIIDVFWYHTIMIIVVFYYIALDHIPHFGLFCERYYIDLSVMRALFLANTIWFRLNSYRFYIATFLDKKSSELASNMGVFFAILALALKPYINPLYYALGALLAHIVASIFLITTVRRNRKKDPEFIINL